MHHRPSLGFSTGILPGGSHHRPLFGIVAPGYVHAVANYLLADCASPGYLALCVRSPTSIRTNFIDRTNLYIDKAHR